MRCETNSRLQQRKIRCWRVSQTSKESLRRILSPASSLDIQSCISCYHFFFSPLYFASTLFFLVFQMAQLAGYAFDSRGIAFPLNPLSKRNPHQKCRKSSIYLFFLHLAVHLQYGVILRELHLRLFNIRGGQPAKAKKMSEEIWICVGRYVHTVKMWMVLVCDCMCSTDRFLMILGDRGQPPYPTVLIRAGRRHLRGAVQDTQRANKQHI